MSEPQRTESAGSTPLSDADREARIEQLLLAGLDQYFAGRYDDAINIWTRVAFLERGHGRARAYIERARGALAEGQRESEELVHAGVAAYQAGDLATARELLTSAVDQGGPNETALIFLQRLSRLEVASSSPQARSFRRRVPVLARGRIAAAASSSNLLTVIASVAAASAILLAALPVSSWLSELPIDAPAARAIPDEPVPVVRSAEIRISRARQLYADGRTHEALAMLDTVGIADPLRPEADRLKADVQRAVLARVETPR